MYHRHGSVVDCVNENKTVTKLSECKQQTNDRTKREDGVNGKKITHIHTKCESGEQIKIVAKYTEGQLVKL